MRNYNNHSGAKSMKNALISLFAGTTLLATAQAGFAAEEPSGNPIIVLKQMSESLASKPAISLSADAVYDEKFEKTYIKSLVSYKLDLIRPSTLYFDAKFDDGEHWLGDFDGKRVRVYVPAEKEYSEVPFEGTLDEFIDYADDNGITRTPLNDFLRSNFFEAVNPHINEATLIDGYVNPDDAKTKISHMLFDSPGTIWQLWVSHGKDTLPDMFNATYSTALGRPEYAVKFKSWAFDGNADGLAEKYSIPKSLDGWTKVEFENPIIMQ